MRRRPDVFVVGVGRSGTSTTCRVLAQQFGFCFGHDPFIGKPDRSGQPVYEDGRIKLRTKPLVAGYLRPSAWLDTFRAVHADCQAERLGVKLLDLRKLTAEQIQQIGVPWIVAAERDAASTIASLARNARAKRDDEERLAWARAYYAEARQELDDFRAGLAGVDVDWTTINYPPKNAEPLTDLEVVEALGRKERP